LHAVLFDLMLDGIVDIPLRAQTLKRAFMCESEDSNLLEYLKYNKKRLFCIVSFTLMLFFTRESRKYSRIDGKNNILLTSSEEKKSGL
jgi:hypothetical protein